MMPPFSQGEAETLQLHQTSLLKSSRLYNVNLITAWMELEADLCEDAEECFHIWTLFGLELEAMILEGCLLSAKGED